MKNRIALLFCAGSGFRINFFSIFWESTLPPNNVHNIKNRTLFIKKITNVNYATLVLSNLIGYYKFFNQSECLKQKRIFTKEFIGSVRV